MADETPRTPSSNELAAIELRHALAGMGPDTDRALMVTLRLADGTYAGDVWLSATDVTALTDGALSMSLVANAESQMRAFADQDAAEPLPVDEDDDAAIAAVGDEAEAFLRDGGQL